MLVRRRRWLDRASGLRRRRPGGYDMGSLGPTHLISLLLAVAIIAATCGFTASAVVRRNKRRARGFFLLGFFCGLTAGAILHGRRRGLNALGAVARCADVRPLRAGIRRGTARFTARALTFAASHVRLGLSPPQWRRTRRCLASGMATGEPFPDSDTRPGDLHRALLRALGQPMLPPRDDPRRHQPC